LLLSSIFLCCDRANEKSEYIDLETKKSIQMLEDILDDDKKLRELLSEEPNLFKTSEKARIQTYLSAKP
jgi:hypothetical protein